MTQCSVWLQRPQICQLAQDSNSFELFEDQLDPKESLAFNISNMTCMENTLEKHGKALRLWPPSWNVPGNTSCGLPARSSWHMWRSPEIHLRSSSAASAPPVNRLEDPAQFASTCLVSTATTTNKAAEMQRLGALKAHSRSIACVGMIADICRRNLKAWLHKAFSSCQRAHWINRQP